MAHEILRSIVGRLLGLNASNDLIFRGVNIHYGDADLGLTEGTLDLRTLSGASVLFATSVSATLAAGPLNDLVPAGYVGGTTNRLLLTAASGGSTINGLSAAGVPDGFTILIQNPSATDPLIFAHLAGGSLAANQFSIEGAGAGSIAALGAARATYIVNKWMFA